MQDTDIHALVAMLHDIVRGVAPTSGGSIKAKDTSGYVHAFLVRKLFLGCLQYGSLKVDWSRTRVATIGEIVPDECMFLQHLPSTLSMAEASRFFFSREDWGVFIPMFACVWHDVVIKTRPEQVTATEEMVSTPAFAERARELSRDAGHNLCPSTLIDDLMPARR